MADNNGSSNTAIVAIVVLILVALGLAFYFGLFGPNTGGGGDTGPSKIIEKPTTIIREKS